jgi:hypothetical protein
MTNEELTRCGNELLEWFNAREMKPQESCEVMMALIALAIGGEGAERAERLSAHWANVLRQNVASWIEHLGQGGGHVH